MLMPGEIVKPKLRNWGLLLVLVLVLGNQDNQNNGTK